ncbi:stage III sporulation protein AB [Youxingia wuxianensis]|uniref:Stage III sporulation protein AB n=1 Tax=Youxingia wuxianensis TaxID=2763678 RepID=A0A926EKS7_9FIRM|nr:stage III sporulation protein AB [Youxingia wuxianensis]MBC8584195.1 stage III sporulation protein AB [Youxingia wuxianensis]
MTGMMKITGMILIAACTTGIGISMAQELSEKVHKLETVIAALCTIADQLSYSLAPLDEIVGDLVKRGSFSQLFFLQSCQEFCISGLPFPTAWRKAVEENRDQLEEEDKGVLAGLADTLGQYDVGGQLTRIEHTKSLLQLRLNEAREKCTTHSKLYRTLGILAGAFFIIIFI